MNHQEELQFHSLLYNAIAEAKSFGYHPKRFISSIAKDGAFQTVKNIVASGRQSEGFDTLALAKRIDLTCEAIIVESEWRGFFDEDLLSIAEKRLTAYKYSWNRYSPPPSADAATTPESVQVSKEAFETTELEDFIPPDSDERQRKLREAYCRSGQAKFRSELIAIYGARCMLTGTDVEEALEAAHICAYIGDKSHHPKNGLLLRADLHNLFDRFMLSINPETLAVHFSTQMRKSNSYRKFEGRRLQTGTGPYPSKAALEVHWRTFNSSGTIDA